MKVSQVKLGAVINTGQYSDIRPEIVVDLDENDTADDAKQLAMSHIADLYKRYGGEGVRLPSGIDATVKRQTLKCFVSGTELQYDPVGHTYIDDEGNEYVSGSKFAHQYGYDFDGAMMAPKSADKLGLTPEQVLEYWRSRGDISTTFGTALHQALEHYGKWRDVIAKDINYKGEEKGHGIHPTLAPIVEAFFEKYGHETAVCEPFVADKKNKRCGQIDRLVIVDQAKKICIIDDYKTNGDLYKQNSPKSLKAPYTFLPNQPYGLYTLQLSFYKAILEANGWTVQASRLHWWNGQEWELVPVNAVEIDGPREKIDVSKIV